MCEAAVRARKHGERKRLPDFAEGELVLLANPLYEKGEAVILPQSASPFKIVRLPTEHTAILADTITDEPYLGGTPRQH